MSVDAHGVSFDEQLLFIVVVSYLQCVPGVDPVLPLDPGMT